MKTEYNLDINPKPDVIALFPNLDYVFDNNALRQAFGKYESKAAHYKKHYWRITKAAVCLIGLSLLSAIGYWLFAEQFPNLRKWSGYAGGIGLVGIFLELYLILGKHKERWLINRFAAERVRSYVAQLYAYGASAKSTISFKRLIDDYTQKCLIELQDETNKGFAAFKRFLPRDGLLLPDAIEKPSVKIFEQCREAYQRLRMDFQKDFINGELERLSNKNRFENATSDISFMMGAILTVAGLFTVPLEMGDIADLISKSLVLAGAASFFLSAILGLIGFGSVSQGHTGRYQNYLDHINSLTPIEEDSPEDFIRRVKEMEMEALRELEAFCLQIDSISIRI